MNDLAPTIYELSVSRFISASPEQVYAAWTGRLPEWWAPKPWTTEIIENDWRPGGRSAMVMRGPAGEASDVEGVFLEIVPNRKIVFTDAFLAGWIPKKPFMCGIFTFEPEGDGTRYTAASRHWDEETMKSHAEMGFEAGWGQVADQFKAICEA